MATQSSMKQQLVDPAKLKHDITNRLRRRASIVPSISTLLMEAADEIDILREHLWGPNSPQGEEIRQLKLVISTQEGDIAEASKKLHYLQQYWGDAPVSTVVDSTE